MTAEVTAQVYLEKAAVAVERVDLDSPVSPKDNKGINTHTQAK